MTMPFENGCAGAPVPFSSFLALGRLLRRFSCDLSPTNGILFLFEPLTIRPFNTEGSTMTQNDVSRRKFYRPIRRRRLGGGGSRAHFDSAREGCCRERKDSHRLLWPRRSRIRRPREEALATATRWPSPSNWLASVTCTASTEIEPPITLRRTTATRPRKFEDFREMYEKGNLDAVSIGTPDHWHAVQAIEAMEKGLDVYCEKPMTKDRRRGDRCDEGLAKDRPRDAGRRAVN